MLQEIANVNEQVFYKLRFSDAHARYVVALDKNGRYIRRKLVCVQSAQSVTVLLYATDDRGVVCIDSEVQVYAAPNGTLWYTFQQQH